MIAKNIGPNVSVTFLGASKTVTGSCYLLDTYSGKFLVDCGMFQSLDTIHLNYEPFRFEPSEIKSVFLTHAHLDHCGLLPRLVANGFRGKIFCSAQTAEITRLILADSANVQANNYRRNKTTPPLYDSVDVINTISLIEEVDFETTEHFEDLSFRLVASSHILGAGSFEISVGNKQLLFSGDIGKQKPKTIKGFGNYATKFDAILMESLYGDQIHTNFDKAIEDLTTIINKTINRNGNVIIPVFAIQRSQDLLMELVNLVKKGKIEDDVQIYFDSPLAYEVLNFYIRSSEYLNPIIDLKSDPFGLRENFVHFTNKPNQSKKIRKQKRAIILAGGGMVNGGRVVSHLANSLEDAQSTLVIVGYQADGTLGKELLTRPEYLNIGTKKLKRSIEIAEVYGFSAHGDRNDLTWWLSQFDKTVLKKLFLVHAELPSSSAFSDFILENKLVDASTEIVIPELFSSHTI